MATSSEPPSPAPPLLARVSSRVCIGLDFQDDTPVAVRAEKSGRKLRTTVLPAAELPAAVGESRALLATALSPRQAFTRPLRIPLQSAAKARRVLPSALDILLPFALEDCVYDFLNVEKGADGCIQALAVVARQQEMDAHLAALRQQGLTPHAVDHEGLALWTQSLRDVPAARSDRPTRRAIVHAGRERWSLALGEGERFLSSHALPPGDPAPIQRILQAAWGQDAGPPAPVLWLWTGPDAENGQTSEPVRRTLLETWPGSASILDQPATFLARALATRALTRGPLRCNLRTGPYAHPVLRRQETRRQARPAWALLLASGLLLTASFSIRGLAARQEARVDHAFARQRDYLIGYHRPVRGARAIEEAREALAAEKRRLHPFLQALRPTQAVWLLRLSRHCAEHDIALDRVALDDETLHLQGTLAAPEDGAGLIDLIDAIGFDGELDREPVDAAERVPFILTGTPRDA